MISVQILVSYMKEINEAVRKLKSSRQTVALTGAGISTASGIPDFRGDHGLWKMYDPSKYAHINTFRSNPEKVWELAMKLLEMSDKSLPNSAHLALAEMEKRGLLNYIITQNIDDLHHRAGNMNVISYHGTVRCGVCTLCNKSEDVTIGKIPVCRDCGKIMKPGFTLFGEAVPPAAYLEARNLASYADVFMIIGTSAVVQPAADLPFIARENGAYIIELNNSETGLSNYITDCFIKGRIEETLPELLLKLN